MSGAGPLLPGNVAELTPELAMSGATGWPADRVTRYTIPPSSTTQRTAATAQARCSVPRCAGWVLATGLPHRWQNRACGESSALQMPQTLVLRLAPHPQQKFPAAGDPQLGHVMARSVIGAVVRRYGSGSAAVPAPLSAYLSFHHCRSIASTPLRLHA